MTLLTSCIAAWLICATIAASITLGYFQGQYPSIAKTGYREDLAMSWFFGLLFGPIAMVQSFFMSRFCKYGMMNPFVLNKYKE